MIRGYLKLIVLKSLGEGPKSGYSLMKHVHQSTGSKPSSGSMYPLLENLRADKLVATKGVGRTTEYSLTQQGKQALLDLEAQRAKITDTIADGMKMLGTLTGEGPPQEIIDLVRKGEIPFKEINPELENLKHLLLEHLKKGELQKSAPKIKKILARAYKEIKSL